MIYQVSRKAVTVEHGTIEAESHAQAADLLRMGMWGDSTNVTRNRETVEYKVNGIEVLKHSQKQHDSRTD